MGSVSNWLDRFCYKHPRFGIPNLMAIIIVGNILVYLMDAFSQTSFSLGVLYQHNFSQYLTFVPYYIFHGQIWRLVTFIFIPMSSSLITVAISCYFYYFIGNMLEREWGNGKFTMFYLIGVVMNIIVGLIVGVVTMNYVNLSLLFAFATLYPNLQVLLFFIIPIKVKWLAWFDAAFFVWDIINYLVHGLFAFSLLPVVAILNYVIFFWGDIAYLFKKVKRRTSPQVVNFKKAQKLTKESKGYLHKCAVCGITDTDRPDMEFRYCSKCNGYYCYCMDHINNHVHIQ